MGKITKTKKTLHQYFTKKSTSGKDETNDTIVSNDVQSETFIEQSCPDDLLHASSSTSVTITAIESTEQSHQHLLKLDATTLNTQNEPSEQSDTSVVLDTNLYDRDPAKGVNIAYKLLSLNSGPYQPINIEFLSHNGRKFLQRWYNIYNWLEYSPSTHSAYCFNCRAFPPNNSDSSFIDRGFCTWSKATFAFNKHEKSLSHKHSTLKVNSYKASFISGSVADKVDNHHQHELAENRMYLSNLLDSLLFCGRQGIGIRGHREDESSLNKGNYLELLNLRAKDNTIINRFFIEKEKTFRYVSVPYTNMFLNYMGKNIKDSIITDIQQAIIFSIIVDETQDLARHEQVSVCVRYVSKTLEPHEVFLGFYRTASTDGESLTTLIKEVILSNGLSINNIRGQCYDGAASMRGSYSGVQARIRDENKLAVYVHCYAHILNLCLVDLSKVIPHVRNTFGTLQSLYSFIGASSKRYSIFEQIMLETSSNGKNKLKSLSDTRWNCRIESIKAVIKTLPVILKTLQFQKMTLYMDQMLVVY